MAQANEPDAWTETFLISIMSKGGSVVEFPAIITTYDISGGDKDFTSIANAKGGRIKNFSVQTDYEISLEGYASQAGNGQGFFDLQNPGTADSTNPLSYEVDHDRTQHLLCIQHTTDTAATSAIAATTQDERALRDTFKNGHFTSVNQSFTDGICKFTVKFKSAPFDKNATANVIFESTDGSATSPLPIVTYA